MGYLLTWSGYTSQSTSQIWQITDVTDGGTFLKGAFGSVLSYVGPPVLDLEFNWFTTMGGTGGGSTWGQGYPSGTDYTGTYAPGGHTWGAGLGTSPVQVTSYDWAPDGSLIATSGGNVVRLLRVGSSWASVTIFDRTAAAAAYGFTGMSASRVCVADDGTVWFWWTASRSTAPTYVAGISSVTGTASKSDLWTTTSTAGSLYAISARHGAGSVAVGWREAGADSVRVIGPGGTIDASWTVNATGGTNTGVNSVRFDPLLGSGHVWFRRSSTTLNIVRRNVAAGTEQAWPESGSPSIYWFDVRADTYEPAFTHTGYTWSELP